MNLFDRFFNTDSDDDVRPGGRDDRRGLLVSLAAHGLLILLMVAGFSTAPDNPGPVQVELWAQGTVADAAAPQEQPEEPQAEPQPESEPAKPEPEPEPTPVPDDSARQAAEQAEAARQAQLAEAQARAAEAAQAQAEAEIALAKERKAREETERRLAEQTAREKAEKEAAEQAAREKARQEQAEKEKAAQERAEKAAAEKAAAEKAAAEKAAAEKAAAEKAAREKAEKEKAEKAAAEKAAAEKAAREKAAKEAEAKRQALRAAMRGDALEAAGIASGNADRNQRGGGGNDGYAAKVRACVQPGVVYNVPPRSGSNNPTASFRTRLGSNGQVQGVDLTRSSGNPRFDDAVQKGILACSPFPKPPGGKYPSYIDVDYRMYD
ncbi:cell envelope integrity protein TolA [Castellaniella ginsengisoli]|uniref:Cell envelope integrity protein TolA n=1 Tax=Castellaniella ginsengisoli TaxID=546114 RepID=A0AB39E786_9BURK